LQAAPSALKVMCAKNFSTKAKFGTMSGVSKNDGGSLWAERRGNILYDETKNNSRRIGKNQRTGWQTIRRASRWLCQSARRSDELLRLFYQELQNLTVFKNSVVTKLG
jgi:hypothetical protein